MPRAAVLRIGLISDTHGLMRPEALAALHGADHIIHAGDICGQHVLDQLGAIAPVTAVRGNNDRDAWGSTLNETERVLLAGKTFFVIHDIAQFDLDPVAAGIHVVIAGHSHKAMHEIRDGVHYLNPGSAGPRRFNLPIGLGLLEIRGNTLTPRLMELRIAS